MRFFFRNFNNLEIIQKKTFFSKNAQNFNIFNFKKIFQKYHFLIFLY